MEYISHLIAIDNSQDANASDYLFAHGIREFAVRTITIDNAWDQAVDWAEALGRDPDKLRLIKHG